MMQARQVIIGTAGHVDHGKTSLIQALTGTNPDRLAEEQARGMTIDLGFAFLDLPGDPPIAAGIVDVPGHERFVKNMLAGAGGVDVALFVVAADEGPMPQTREHSDILTVLGVTRGVVALTKCDVADAELRELAEETTREMLAKTPLADAPLIPVSAVTGEGLDALKTALARIAATVPPRDAAAPFRLPVDRVFSMAGVGTIVTGTLIAGTLRVGDSIAVQPQDLRTKARTLQTHNQKVEAATPGMRIAVNLPGIEVGQIERGAVLCPPGTLTATTLIDVRLTLLPDAPRPLRRRERARVHLGTGEILARVQLMDRAEIAPGESNIPAQLLCETPAAPIRGERFVVRSYSPAHAIGGGVIVETNPTRRYRAGDAAAQRLFEARGSGEMTDTIYAGLAARPADFSVAEIAQAASVTPERAMIALETLVEERRAFVLTDGRYLSNVAAERLRETARRTLTAYHRQNPYRKAMARDNLRVPLSKAAIIKDFNAAVTFLVAQGVAVAEDETNLRLPDHEVVLPQGWKRPAAEMLTVYQSAGFNPPAPDNFQANYPRDVNVRTILTILAETGELVHIGDDLYLSAETFAAALAHLRRLAVTPEGATVGTLRDATGSSRKIILPLLEYLDARRLTRRTGDKRELI